MSPLVTAIVKTGQNYGLSPVVIETRVLQRALHSVFFAALCIIPTSGGTAELEGGIGTLDCVINPSMVADLGSSAPGILASVAVDRSDYVQAGDVIAELESGVESASVELAKTRAESTAEIDLRRVNAAYGYRLRKRTKDLFQRNVVSTNDLDERETEARLARIQLRQARENSSIAKMEMVRAEEILKRRTIKSPITGVVMERFKVVGEYVEDQPVARVAQLDPLHVEVIVPVEHLGEVTPGMTAEVWTDVVESDRWVAEVTRVDKVADVASGTYGVRLSLPNPEYQIPAGLRCQMRLVEMSLEPIAVEERPNQTAAKPVALSAPATGETGEARVSGAEKAAIEEEVELLSEVVPGEQTVTVANDLADVPEPLPQEPVDVAAPEDTEAEDKHAEAAIELADALATWPQEPVDVAMPVVAEADDVTALAAIEEAAERVSAPLVAVSEPSDPPDPELLAVDALSEAVVVDEPPACRVAGPFKDEVVATRKVVKLRRAGLSVDIKSVAKGRRVELKIMTPVLENHAAAQAVITKLKKAGLSDYYVHKMPAGKRRVYLGIYNSKPFADIRLRELSDAGIKAFSRPSKNSGLDYFLVIRGVPGDDTEQVMSHLPMTQDKKAEKLGFCDKLAGN